MELLAPAGSKESFIAAIQAGADAVYVGIKNFNARINASNLNLYDLEVLIDYAKQNKVKTYITFNTLIKHSEINEAIQTIDSINNLKPDALIVQDLGIARIVSEYFPNIPLHASTQMAIHNSTGMDILAKIGFKRIVLARELTFPEIKNISKNSANMELEIFVHGALCFSISGMCLFSSIIGGNSGNRGLCTQPCRRIWKSAKQNGYLFSPRDLELAPFVNELKKIHNIKSLKIEGRMRSSEYVSKVVTAYRLLIDTPLNDYESALLEAKRILAFDYARKKSTCMFEGRDPNLFEPTKPQCLGLEIGTVQETNQNTIVIKSDKELFIGNRLSIPSNENNRIVITLKDEPLKNEDLYTINHSSTGCNIGNPVFILGGHDWNIKEITKEINNIYDNYSKEHKHSVLNNHKVSNTYTSLLARLWIDHKNNFIDDENIWIKTDNTEWLPILLNDFNNKFIIFSINKNNIHSFKNYITKLAFTHHDIQTNKLAIELPPFIAQREINSYKNIISFFSSKNINKYIINNISQLALLPSISEKIAGSYLYTWNAYSARLLKEYNVNHFFISWEDDIVNIMNLCNSGLKKQLMINIFGYPVITRSRMLPKRIDYNIVTSGKNDFSFKQILEGEMNLLIPDKPVMIFNATDKLKNLGIKHFVIDLSFINPDKNFLEDLMQSFKYRTNLDNSFKFNFKRGVK